MGSPRRRGARREGSESGLASPALRAGRASGQAAERVVASRARLFSFPVLPVRPPQHLLWHRKHQRRAPQRYVDAVRIGTPRQTMCLHAPIERALPVVQVGLELSGSPCKGPTRGDESRRKLHGAIVVVAPQHDRGVSNSEGIRGKDDGQARRARPPQDCPALLHTASIPHAADLPFPHSGQASPPYPCTFFMIPSYTSRSVHPAYGPATSAESGRPVSSATWRSRRF